ncbi:MAG: DUF805 domain-containing protein [Alphaproteobacteria bacterium]|nr:MAG: DUF805 domain-containing protein [Alphaproteobacteria bacterium]
MNDASHRSIIRQWLRYVFSSKGRASRKDYWVVIGFFVALWIAFFTSVIINYESRSQRNAAFDAYPQMGYLSLEEEQTHLQKRQVQMSHAAKKQKMGVSTVLSVLAFIAVSLWGLIAIHIRRLHDLNQTGWFVVAAVIPYFGILALVAWCGFFEGTNGRNRYGGA